MKDNVCLKKTAKPEINRNRSSEFTSKVFWVVK